MGAPPSAGESTASQATEAVLPDLVACACAGAAGARARARQLTQVTVPKSVPVLVTVTSTDAAVVRVTVTGTVNVVPELVTAAVLPFCIATPEPLGKVTVAPVRK